MKAIFALINTTLVVVKIGHEKNSRPVQVVVHSVVVITAKIAFIHYFPLSLMQFINYELLLKKIFKYVPLHL